MKITKFNSIGMLCLILALFIFTGASCPNAQRNAYTTISSVELTASAAYDGYVDAVLAGRVATNDLPAVSLKFNQVQTAARLAAAATQAGTNGLAPEALITDAANLAAMIQILQNKSQPTK